MRWSGGGCDPLAAEVSHFPMADLRGGTIAHNQTGRWLLLLSGARARAAWKRIFEMGLTGVRMYPRFTSWQPLAGASCFVVLSIVGSGERLGLTVSVLGLSGGFGCGWLGDPRLVGGLPYSRAAPSGADRFPERREEALSRGCRRFVPASSSARFIA